MIKTLATASLLLAGAYLTGSSAQAADPGITDSEILIGDVEPLTGPPIRLSAPVQSRCRDISGAVAKDMPGCEVVATDASTEMLRIGREKARRHSAGDRVKFAQGHARDIDRILGGEPDGSYDGAYSSFALSYEQDLRAVRRALSRLV